MKWKMIVSSCLFAALVSSPSIGVETEIFGATASIGNGFTGGSHPEGSHFHSSNLEFLPAGNPPILLAGVAEVGGFFGDEEIRGTSEFQLGDTAQTATLHFNVLDTFAEGFSPVASGVDGLFGQGSYVGFVDVFAYIADGNETISDYEVTPLSETPILSIDVQEGTVTGGDPFSIDITDTYNALATNDSALGIRLQMRDSDADAGAITFHNFSIGVQTVPEPASNLLTLSGVVMLLAIRRKRR